jgi:hypothetical protein
MASLAEIIDRISLDGEAFMRAGGKTYRFTIGAGGKLCSQMILEREREELYALRDAAPRTGALLMNALLFLTTLGGRVLHPERGLHRRVAVAQLRRRRASCEVVGRQQRRLVRDADPDLFERLEGDRVGTYGLIAAAGVVYVAATTAGSCWMTAKMLKTETGKRMVGAR